MMTQTETAPGTQCFDLVEEAWIPVVNELGREELLGLRETLLRAHELREIRDGLPTVEFGLYRLLSAIVLDMCFRAAEDRYPAALGELLQRGRFDQEQTQAYFEECGKVFDLFDAERPFLQTAGMEGEEAKALAGLAHAMPSGTNAAHFHHPHEDEFAVCPAAAARLLTTIAPFMTAGGAGLSPSINGAPPWYVLVRSGNRPSLFATLCLNSLVTGQEEYDTPPAWRAERALTKDGSKTRRKNASLLEAMSWRPRRICLIPGGPGRCSLTGSDSAVTVREMRFSAGDSCDFSWTDPAVAYRVTAEKGPLPLRPQEGREVWRDTGPLALLQEGEYASRDGKTRFSRPALVGQFGTLYNYGYLAQKRMDREQLALTVYGLRTDMKMKIFEWQREELCLDAPLVWQGSYHGQAQRAMENAERVGALLRGALKTAYPRDAGGNKAGFDSLIADAQRRFWTALRPAYEELLRGLAPLAAEGVEDEVKALLDRWRAAVERAGKRDLDDALEPLDADRNALKRCVEARRNFGWRMRAVFEPPAPGEKRGRKAAVADVQAG